MSAQIALATTLALLGIPANATFISEMLLNFSAKDS